MLCGQKSNSSDIQGCIRSKDHQKPGEWASLGHVSISDKGSNRYCWLEKDNLEATLIRLANPI